MLLGGGGGSGDGCRQVTRPLFLVASSGLKGASYFCSGRTQYREKVMEHNTRCKMKTQSITYSTCTLHNDK